MSEESKKVTAKKAVEISKNKEVVASTSVTKEELTVDSVKSIKVPKKRIKKTVVTPKSDNIMEKDSVIEEIVSVSEEVNIEKSPKKKSSEKAEEFDWDKAAQNDVYSKKERSDFEIQYSETLPDVVDKQVIDGTVVLVSDREVVIDINFKSDGVISFNEFKYNPELKAGDTVEVLVEKQEDKNGQLVLSHRRARVLRAWEKVNIALETGEVVNGQIMSRTKGGMIVDIFGIECFLPGSQIDVKPIRDYDEYVGKKNGI
jgi:small subunit ribosomal protein S1